MRTILSLFFLVSSAFWYGCASASDASRTRQQPLTSPDSPANTVVDARPAALVNGRSVSWGELRPLLSEAAGDEMLRELILDRMVEQAVTEAGLVITPNDIAAERALLARTLNDDPNLAARLLDELRSRQGLGPVRFNSLMYRNAALRALVRDRVDVSDAAARRMFETVHGPTRQARLMVLPTLAVARRAAERIDSGEHFGEVASELSTDVSASRGGLLEAISRADGSYPEALRTALFELQPNELSRPILLEDQFGLLMLVREQQGDGVQFEDVRDDMFSRVELQQQRMLMDQLARELVRDVTVTIFDDSLNESWRRARRMQP